VALCFATLLVFAAWRCAYSAAYAAVWCLIVCRSRSCIVSKRVNIFSNFFTFWCTILVFFAPNVMAIFRRLHWECRMQVGYEKIAIIDQYLTLSRKWCHSYCRTSNSCAICRISRLWATPNIDFKVMIILHPITRKWCKIQSMEDWWEDVYDLSINATFSDPNCAKRVSLFDVEHLRNSTR